MIELPTVTLCAVSSVKISATLRALQKSMRSITYAKVIFITNETVTITDPRIEIVKIEKLDYNGYSHFIAYRLKDYIATEHVLLVQHDGYVLHPQKWDPAFLVYDYIGAPWPPNIHFTAEGVTVRVGNGAFSLRSKRLLEMPTRLNLPFTDNGTGFLHEDGLLCAYHRKALEDAGIRFAPVSVAAQFSHESDCPESIRQPFGFHGSKLVLPRALWLPKKILRALNIRL